MNVVITANGMSRLWACVLTIIAYVVLILLIMIITVQHGREKLRRIE